MKFEDLQEIKSYGFRGEALSSISQVANLSVVTMTENDSVAYRAYYKEGRIIPPPGRSSKAVPIKCAGVKGTQITVTNLFDVKGLRRRLDVVKRNKKAEFDRITHIVGSYALHNPNVSFTLRKVRFLLLLLSLSILFREEIIKRWFIQEKKARLRIK